MKVKIRVVSVSECFKSKDYLRIVAVLDDELSKISFVVPKDREQDFTIGTESTVNIKFSVNPIFVRILDEVC